MPHNGQVIMGNEVAIVAFLHSPPPFLSWLSFYLGWRRALGVMTSSGGRAEIIAFETRAVWWGDTGERRRRQIHPAPLQGAAEKCQGRFSAQSQRKWGRSELEDSDETKDRLLWNETAKSCLDVQYLFLVFIGCLEVWLALYFRINIIISIVIWMHKILVTINS